MAVREIKIGVKDLLEILFHPKDLGEPGFSMARAREGSSGHRLIRDRRPAEYAWEVPVEFAYEWEDYRLVVRGRIDGYLEQDGEIWLEEIKTTYLPLDELNQETYPQHLAQLRLYLYFVQSAHPDCHVTGRLTYLNLNDLAERTFPVEYSVAEGQAFFTSLAVAFLQAAQDRDTWQNIRNASLEQLAFPFRERRPGQDELMDMVNLALEQGLDLFAEAATGIGKTVGVLYPALKRLARGDRFQQIFFLTAKTQGKEIVRKTLAAAKEQGLRLRTVFIEAKERVCLHPGAECRAMACPCASDYYSRAEAALPELLQEELIVPERVLEYARQHRLCPFELSLDLSLQADLIVCDYNYVFDPGVYLKRFFLYPGERRYLFLVDEAHNLVGRGREMYSAALSQGELVRLRRGLQDTDRRLARAFAEVEDYFQGWRREMAEENRTGLLLGDLPEMLEPALERLAVALERFLASSVPGEFTNKVRQFYFDLNHFLRVLGFAGADYARFVMTDGKQAELKVFCQNPGTLLRRRLDWAHCTIFFSATLSPFVYFRELLGGRQDALHLQLLSPFPQENRLYLHVPGIDTRYKAREESAYALAQIVIDMVNARTGNYLAFFPSYTYLNAVKPLILQGLTGKAGIYFQHPAMNDEQKKAFLEKVTAVGTGRSNLGLAVLGGLFGEGVDMPGEQLVGVCIIGPGLPAISPEQELIRRYFDERNGRGFLYAYVIPGLIRVIQSAGRVFRTPEDRGVVLLVDDRFANPEYQELLPPDWFMAGRPFSRPDYREALADFWAEYEEK